MSIKVVRIYVKLNKYSPAIAATDNAVPRRIVRLVKFFLNIDGDVFFDAKFTHRIPGTSQCMLLHLKRHVTILHNCSTCAHVVIGKKIFLLNFENISYKISTGSATLPQECLRKVVHLIV